MMTSFKLVNVLSIFQRYINWALQNFLNEFCSAYVNDILIFIDELLYQHWNYVWKILLQLQEVGLQIDIDKCEFEVKSTKYLEFILKVRKSVQINSQKMKTIMNCISKLRKWLRASSKHSECSDLWILCSSSELLEVVTITHHRQMHSERFCSSQSTIHNMCWIHLFQSSDIHWLNCICHFTCQGHTLC